jgi:xylulokinase
VRALRASGGGARGALWPQVVSDVTGLPQRHLHESAGASYGDALLAAVAAGRADLSTTWAEPAGEVLPDERPAALYDELYRVYRDLYLASKPQAHALAALQRSGNGLDGVSRG